MVITVSGTQNTGKSTFIKDFIEKFPMYKTHPTSFREYAIANNIPLNRQTCKASQTAALEWFENTLAMYERGSDNVILDRTVLDVFVYTLRSFYQKDSDIDSQYIIDMIPRVRAASKKIDIMFFIPFDENLIKIEEDGYRDTNKEFITEIDLLFKTLCNEYTYGKESELFAKDDCPPVIDIFGDRKSRIAIAELYVEQSTGNIIVDEKSILDPTVLGQLEKELKEQEALVNKEKFIIERMKKNGQF